MDRTHMKNYQRTFFTCYIWGENVLYITVITVYRRKSIAHNKLTRELQVLELCLFLLGATNNNKTCTKTF